MKQVAFNPKTPLTSHYASNIHLETLLTLFFIEFEPIFLGVIPKLFGKLNILLNKFIRYSKDHKLLK